MGWGNREVEIKLQVLNDFTFNQVSSQLRDFYGDICDRIISGASKDIYFKAPRASKADFVRVRYGTRDELSQITLKYSDRGTNKNRVEIDVEVSDPDQAEVLLKYCLGKPVGKIKKKYHVYFLNDYDNVSCYQIDGDDRVFIEIEAKTRKKVDKLRKELTSTFLDLKVINKSLYQLFLKEAS